MQQMRLRRSTITRTAPVALLLAALSLTSSPSIASADSQQWGTWTVSTQLQDWGWGTNFVNPSHWCGRKIQGETDSYYPGYVGRSDMWYNVLDPSGAYFMGWVIGPSTTSNSVASAQYLGPNNTKFCHQGATDHYGNGVKLGTTSDGFPYPW